MILISYQPQCPRCQAPVTESNGSNQCSSGHRFPVVMGIPLIVKDPDATISNWTGLINLELEKVASQLDNISKGSTSNPITHDRVTKLQKALKRFDSQIRDILSDLARSAADTCDLKRALASKLPMSQSLTAYITNVHRDWGWKETNENKASLDEILKVVPDSRFSNVAVIGAGSCRLAMDLHCKIAPKNTVAVDMNPLLLSIGKSIIEGKVLDFVEFPKAPLNLESSAVYNKLQLPKDLELPDSTEINFLYADASTNWAAPKSFDLVVTPWFIDIIPEPPESFFRRINSMLKDGGVWINFGSVAWQTPNPYQNYSREEIIDYLQASGFSMEAKRESQIPYLQSPHSAHGRIENTLTFCARKTSHCQPPAAFEFLAEWLTDHTLPVQKDPLMESSAISHAIYTHVLSMVDGDTSINDMCKKMESDLGMDSNTARTSLTNFLSSLAIQA